MDQDHKIDDVEERINQLQTKGENMKSVGAGSPMAGSSIGADFAVAVLGGAVLGFLVDLAKPAWAPWPLLAMTFLGFASGLVSMWRSLNSKAKDKPQK